jgi:hypothetical protein
MFMAKYSREERIPQKSNILHGLGCFRCSCPFAVMAITS